MLWFLFLRSLTGCGHLACVFRHFSFMLCSGSETNMANLMKRLSNWEWRNAKYISTVIELILDPGCYPENHHSLAMEWKICILCNWKWEKLLRLIQDHFGNSYDKIVFVPKNTDFFLVETYSTRFCQYFFFCKKLVNNLWIQWNLLLIFIKCDPHVVYRALP